MDQVGATSVRRKGRWATLGQRKSRWGKSRWATLAIAAVTSAGAIAFPATSSAVPQTPTPVPPPPAAQGPGGPPPAPAAPNPAPPPGGPVAPPPPAGAVAPPPPVDPNAGRITNAVGGFSFVLPAGWVESDASHLDYGSALLSKITGPPPMPGQAPPVANDTRIVLGRLDQKLYAGAEPNNAKASVRLGSDMGEFFMPYPGTRINQDTATLGGPQGLTGSASYYEVKFSDTSKSNGQIWTGVVGSSETGRWFVVWLGTANDPVDKNGARALAESIRPWTPPAAPAPAPGGPAPAPGAPPPPVPGVPPPAPAPAPAPGAPPPAPAPAPAAPPPAQAPPPAAPPPAQAPPPGRAPAGAQAPQQRSVPA